MLTVPSCLQPTAHTLYKPPVLLPFLIKDHSLFFCVCLLGQGYQWLKDKILSEEGRRQQAKLKELQAIAERLGCTLPQLAIGKLTAGCRE